MCRPVSLSSLLCTAMGIYRSRVAVMALLLSFALMTRGQDFGKARALIEAAKPNIDYKAFCSEMPAGEDKIACRIKDVPSVGFLVCKAPEVEEEGEITPCKTIISNELGNILKLGAAQVKTVTVSQPLIDGVRCGAVPSSNECSGFLEGWVDKSVGVFQQVRDHISGGTVGQLITTVKQITKAGGLATTAADLSSIVKYMEVDKAGKTYRQICDIQGFFLVNGGFLVGDIPSIDEGMAIDQPCWDGEPTTKQVLDALNTMIKAFD